MLDLIALSGLGAGAFLLTPAELHRVGTTRIEHEQELAWNHTASLLCMINNMVAGKSAKRQVDDFHPMRKPKRQSVGIRDIRNAIKRKDKGHGKIS